MTTLRTLVIFTRSLVILTIGMAGAAVLDSLLTETWHGTMVSISRAYGTNR
jgi:hypothetical protein